MSSSEERPEIAQLTERLFREEAGRLVSVMTGIFGIERLQLAEDVVQEALVRALQTWPYYGMPDNPAAWLTQTAKRVALDVVRREKRFRDKQPEIEASMDRWASGGLANEPPTLDGEIQDDRLRLMFVCCHPVLPDEAQTALALRTLCGFSPAEIGRAFLTSDAAIEKRLTRARQKIRSERIPYEIPAGPVLSGRLEGVLRTLYLLFNEGYKASTGDELVREELCFESIRLTSLLSAHPAGDDPRTHALLALMLLNAARLSGRTDSDGNMLRLTEQDRDKWDRQMIVAGIRQLEAAAAADVLSEYHIQAGIAVCHCTAPSEAETDWARILHLYDLWIRHDDSPVIALNRAVAVANVRGAQAGIDAVEVIRHRRQLKSYYLLHAVLGEFQARLRNFEEAVAQYRRALELSGLKAEQVFLLERLRSVEAGAESAGERQRPPRQEVGRRA